MGQESWYCPHSQSIHFVAALGWRKASSPYRQCVTRPSPTGCKLFPQMHWTFGSNLAHLAQLGLAGSLYTRISLTDLSMYPFSVLWAKPSVKNSPRIFIVCSYTRPTFSLWPQVWASVSSLFTPFPPCLLPWYPNGCCWSLINLSCGWKGIIIFHLMVCQAEESPVFKGIQKNT